MVSLMRSRFGLFQQMCKFHTGDDSHESAAINNRENILI